MIGLEQLGGAGIFIAGAGIAVKLLYPLIRNGGKSPPTPDLTPLYDLHRDTNLTLRGIEQLLVRQGIRLDTMVEQLAELHRKNRE